MSPLDAANAKLSNISSDAAPPESTSEPIRSMKVSDLESTVNWIEKDCSKETEKYLERSKTSSGGE